MSETMSASPTAESRMVSAPGGRLHVREFPGAEPALVVMHPAEFLKRRLQRRKCSVTGDLVGSAFWIGESHAVAQRREVHGVGGLDLDREADEIRFGMRDVEPDQIHPLAAPECAGEAALGLLVSNSLIALALLIVTLRRQADSARAVRAHTSNGLPDYWCAPQYPIEFGRNLPCVHASGRRGNDALEVRVLSAVARSPRRPLRRTSPRKTGPLLLPTPRGVSVGSLWAEP